MPLETSPPVVAIVVTCNPGPWFEETLDALREQDYPNLAVLIVDAASLEDPLPRVAERLPHAYVRRLSKNPGYSAATNRAMRIIQGASHLVLCHDDAAPEPDAVRKMMEQALRTNAGVVTPKMVDWNDPRILLEMGGTVDFSGAFISAVERADMDQGQHDDASEVFVAGGGFLLVRADLFSTLGGFDAAMTLYGEGQDFCWRAQMAGATVATAPAARVRHLEAAVKGMRIIGSGSNESDDPDPDADPSRSSYDEVFLRRRHQLRTVLKLPAGVALPLVAVRQLVFNALEALYATISGRPNDASAIVAAWSWNGLHWRGLVGVRRRAQRARQRGDQTLARQFGSARTRVAGRLRQEWFDRRERLAREAMSREFASMRKIPLAVVLVIAGVWVIGSRDLFFGGLPTVGQFAPLPDGPGDAISRYLGLVPGSFGTSTTSSAANLFVALGGTFLLGAMGILHKLLVLGALPLGVWGMNRLARPLKSTRSRLMMITAYAAVPLPYDSLASARIDGLICYAAAPWILLRLLRAFGSAPFFARKGSISFTFRRAAVLDDDDLRPLIMSEAGATGARAAEALLRESGDAARPQLVRRTDRRRDRAWFIVVRQVFPLALLVAAVATVAPQILGVTIVAALAALAAEKIAGHDPSERSRDTKRGISIVLAATGIATALSLAGLLGSDEGLANLWRALPSSNLPDGFGTLLRFHGQSTAWSILTFGLTLGALPAVLIGKSWRWQLSLRLWMITLSLVFVTWLGAHGLLGPWVPDPHVYLAMAAAALTLNVGVGAVAFQTDLRDFRFGWRQAIPLFALAGVVLSMVPVMGKAINGSWNLPEFSNTSALGWMPEKTSEGSFRVLWLGQGDVMPGGPRRVSDDLAAAVAVDSATPRAPDAVDNGGAGQEQLLDAVREARRGNTVQLGHLVAPYGVRYIVVPLLTGPTNAGGRPAPPPAGVESMLADQLDLRTIDSDESLLVYENSVWVPIRSVTTIGPLAETGVVPAADAVGASAPVPVAPDAGPTPAPEAGPPASQAPGAAGPAASQAPGAAGPALATGTEQTSPVLPQTETALWSGSVPAADVVVREAESSSWNLTVDGRAAARSSALEWASSYAVGEGGDARLTFSPSGFVRAFSLLTFAAWALIGLIAANYRVRRGRYV